MKKEVYEELMRSFEAEHRTLMALMLIVVAVILAAFITSGC